MGSEDKPPGLMAIFGPPAVVAASVFLLHFLPYEVLTFLTAWVALSFPIGVLFGHCVLSEE